MRVATASVRAWSMLAEVPTWVVTVTGTVVPDRIWGSGRPETLGVQHGPRQSHLVPARL